MNKKHLWTLAVAVGIMATCLLTVGCEEEKADPAPVKTSFTIAPVAVKGVLASSESGLTLFDGQETHVLKSDLGLDDMLGKTVQVKGTLEKGESGVFIRVDQVVAAESAETAAPGDDSDTRADSDPDPVAPGTDKPQAPSEQAEQGVQNG